MPGWCCVRSSSASPVPAGSTTTLGRLSGAGRRIQEQFDACFSPYGETLVNDGPSSLKRGFYIISSYLASASVAGHRKSAGIAHVTPANICKISADPLSSTRDLSMPAFRADFSMRLHKASRPHRDNHCADAPSVRRRRAGGKGALARYQRAPHAGKTVIFDAASPTPCAKGFTVSVSKSTGWPFRLPGPRHLA